ncbi:hypothetical protein BG004_001251 [Podila humilis]|nr:hypothetical protein BG004_001251 [Podila humilis]
MVGCPRVTDRPILSRSDLRPHVPARRKNYGVPSRELRDPLLKDLPKYFESSGIHNRQPHCRPFYGIDIRAMTKKIRSQGVILGKILFPADAEWMKEYQNIGLVDPNERNLVAEDINACMFI